MNIKKNKLVLALSIVGLGVVLLAVISQTFKNDEPSVPYMLIYEDAKIVNRAVKLIYSSNLDSAKILLEEVISRTPENYSNDYFIATTSEVINGICSIGVTKIEPKHGKGCGDTLSILGNVDISFTNASLFMIISALTIISVFFVGTRRKAIIPTKIQLLTELSYTLVSKMISDTAGSKAKPYFPFVFSLFMFVLFCNMLGMLPYSFTVTSHIIVTFALAAVIFVGVTIIGFVNHGVGYLKLFIPSGVPIFLLPLIVIIEIISYLSRPVSLSVRLFANMMAGHTMLKVFGGFVISLGIIGGWLPLSFTVALTGLEILIAFLQAYVFAILTCIYLNDALNLNH